MEGEIVQTSENQEIKDTHAPNGWGGRRENAGRKRHSRDKLTVADFFTPEDIQLLMQELRTQVFEKHDKDLTKFAIEQIFGKAMQRNELTGADGSQLVFAIAKEIVDKNDLNTETSIDSER